MSPRYFSPPDRWISTNFERSHQRGLVHKIFLKVANPKILDMYNSPKRVSIPLE